jgi:transglycosylase-like protein
LRAPLIAVFSVGIAAAAPAVAISAGTPSTGASGQQATPAPVQTDLHQPVGPVTFEHKTRSQIRHEKLERRFLVLRNRANRLIAERRGTKARIVHTARQLRWSNPALGQAIRVLRKRIRRLRAAWHAQRAGLTPAVRRVLSGIAACESKGNPRAVGGGGAFRGKYQFTYGTWRAVGGHGDPAAASEAEQDRRAAMLLRRSGTSPWPVCGT